MTADPPVARPATAPVRVPLFSDFRFKDFAAQAFRYAPPGGARRRWARVIFVADFAVSAGRQFDRTCQVSLGSVNVYYGTTAEPRRRVGPAWHVERDVTDYSALLRRPQAGVVSLGNVVDATYTGLIRGSAALLFYPPGPHDPAPATPDVVLPIPDAPGGAALARPSDRLTRTLTLPRNVTRAYLDVITQSQGGDEFWYFGVPDRLAASLKATGGTAFREAEVSVDGRPAGVAPVYPWVYTGGISPALWSPIPGVQTLNLAPYRVDLTPFAAVLSDGRPHTLAVQVYNAHDYFRVVGTLLLYRDPVLKAVTGALTTDTLTSGPSPAVLAHVTGGDGAVRVTSDRRFQVGGFVDTSGGRVWTLLSQSVGFRSAQTFKTSAARSAQSLRQLTTVRSDTRTTRRAARTELRRNVRYSLVIGQSARTGADKSGTQTVRLTQGYRVTQAARRHGAVTFASTLSDAVRSADTQRLDADSHVAGHAGRSGATTYTYSDSTGAGYSRALAAADGLLTSATTVRKSGRGRTP